MSDSNQEFKATACWDALNELLRAQMPGVDVQPITDKDFGGEGELVLNPPSVRVMYDSTTRSEIGGQSLSFYTTHKFLVLCGDDDRTAAFDQARASLVLSEMVEELVAGARLKLPTGELSAPATLIERVQVPVAGLGTAYGVGIEVPGTTSFNGTNANPA